MQVVTAFTFNSIVHAVTLAGDSWVKPPYMSDNDLIARVQRGHVVEVVESDFDDPESYEISQEVVQFSGACQGCIRRKQD